MRLAFAFFLFLCLGAGVISCSKKTPVALPVVNAIKASIDTPKIILPDSGLVYPYTDTFNGSGIELVYTIDVNTTLKDSLTFTATISVVHPGNDKIIINGIYGPVAFTRNLSDYYLTKAPNDRYDISVYFFPKGPDTFQFINSDLDYRWAYKREICGLEIEDHFCHFFGKKRKK